MLVKYILIVAKNMKPVQARVVKIVVYRPFILNKMKFFIMSFLAKHKINFVDVGVHNFYCFC